MQPISQQIKQLIEENVLTEEPNEMNQLMNQDPVSSDSDDEDDYEDAQTETSRHRRNDTDDHYDDDDEDDYDEDHLFKDQVKSVISWMGDLSPCQQVVSLLSLMATLTESQSVFISNHLQNRLTQSSTPSLKKNISDANSLSFWRTFFSVNTTPSIKHMLDLLLEYLPLVSSTDSSGNSAISLLYLHLVTSTLKKLTSSPTPADKETLDKSRQLLSFALVSSIFSSEQKKNLLSPYTSKLMIQSCENNYIESTIRNSQNRKSDPLDMNRRSDPVNSCLGSPLVKPFSGQGMSGVPGYLKGLRLHKYTSLFGSLTCLNHFLNLTDDQLESLGVAAKGARKKFIQSLTKLKQRPDLLKSLLNSGPKEILSGVSEVIATPLCSESPEVNLILHLMLKGMNCCSCSWCCYFKMCVFLYLFL